jgi:hypothetical protein
MIDSPGFNWSRGLFVGYWKLAVIFDRKPIILTLAQSVVEIVA